MRLIAGIVERIETALDEGIVERADRQQAAAKQRMRQAERRQHGEEIHLGDAELEMLTFRTELPFLRRGNPLVAEGVGHDLAREQAPPIDPGSEIRRDGHIGRCRDDGICEAAAGAGDSIENFAEAGLGRALQWDVRREACGHFDPSGSVPAPSGDIERNLVEKDRSWSGGTASPSKGSHSRPSATSISCRKAIICAVVITPAWLSL